MTASGVLLFTDLAKVGPLSMLTAAIADVFAGPISLKNPSSVPAFFPGAPQTCLRGRMVRNEGQVAVVFAPGSLVHPDIGQGLEAAPVELFGHDTFTDRPNGPPRYPGELGDGGLIRPGDQPGDHVLESPC